MCHSTLPRNAILDKLVPLQWSNVLVLVATKVFLARIVTLATLDPSRVFTWDYASPATVMDIPTSVIPTLAFAW